MSSSIDFTPSASSDVHWLPCKIGFDGSCQDVQSKFEPVNSGTHWETTLRGRPMQGAQYKLHEGYTGHLLQLQHGSDGAGNKQWKSVAQFDELTYWNHGMAPSKTDAQRRVLDFLPVAAGVQRLKADLKMQIHAPIPLEEVMEMLKTMPE